MTKINQPVASRKSERQLQVTAGLVKKRASQCLHDMAARANARSKDFFGAPNAPRAAEGTPPTAMQLQTPKTADESAVTWRDVFPPPTKCYNHVYLVTHPFCIFPGTLTPSENTDKIRAAAHHGLTGYLYNMAALVGSERRRLEASIAHEPAPSLQSIEYTNAVCATADTILSHAAVHAVLGRGTVADKIGSLSALGVWIDLNDVRLADLNLLHVAARSPMAGADRAALVECLIEHRVNPYALSAKGSTPLHVLAAQPDSAAAMQHILDAGGCDINVRDHLERTPLFVLLCTHPENRTAINLLLLRGADARFMTSEGDTMLHAVLESGDHPDIVEALLRRGACPASCGSRGESALHKALRLGHSGSLRLIAEHFPTQALQPPRRPRLGGGPVLPELSVMIPNF